MGGLLSYAPGADEFEDRAEEAPEDAGRDQQMVVSTEDVKSKGGANVSGRYTCSRKFQQDYILLDKILGTGASGPVHLAESRSSGQKFAVKSFRKAQLSTKHRLALKNEVELYLQLAHPHIAQLQMVFECEDALHLVMELMEGGELYDRVSKEGRYGEAEAASTIYQILLAVAYLHAKNIAHRDLKLENFLYERETSSRIKLIDFGFAKYADASGCMSKACGTVHYVAPEVLSKSYTVQADMWSLGVIAYMLLTGAPLFFGSNADILDRVRAGRVRFNRDFSLLSAEAQSFVGELLLRDPSRRLTAAQALEHPWIRGRGLAPGGPRIDAGLLGSLQDFASSPRLRKATLRRMAWALSPEEQAGLREQFLLMDVHKRGSIRLGELKLAFQETDLEECLLRNDIRLEDLFPAAGGDCGSKGDDREMDYSEFLAAALAGRANAHDALLRRTFSNFELGHQGLLAVEDLRAALDDSFEGADVEELAAALGELGDGRSVAYEDFVAYLQTAKPASGKLGIEDLNVATENSNIISGDLKAEVSSLLKPGRAAMDPTRSLEQCNEQMPILLGRPRERFVETFLHLAAVRART